jgi:hypothetical protein
MTEDIQVEKRNSSAQLKKHKIWCNKDKFYNFKNSLPTDFFTKKKGRPLKVVLFLYGEQRGLGNSFKRWEVVSDHGIEVFHF